MSLTLHPGRLAPSRAMPRLRRWDSSLALRADPYRFIARTCGELGTEVFETRLLLQRTVCMSGARAAALFYDPRRFQREGAAPEALQATLFGKGGVQGLDGPEHRQRKAFFMAATAPGRVAELVWQVRRQWEQALPAWSATGPLPLYGAIQQVLVQAACRWAGVPLPEADVPRRTRQLAALFDAAAAGPWQHLGARRAHRQAEAWLAGLVQAVRAQRMALPRGSAADAAAWHRDAAGELLPPRVAAVELLNLLRPTVAVSVYIVFVAHALHMHPGWKPVLAGGSTAPLALPFVQEVRRHYPFFPAVMARVREDFCWNGLLFPRGRRVMLDLYGTNHDGWAWEDAQLFRPERWQHLRPGRFDFVPQGGGDAATHHRCPGESVALRLMLLALDMLGGMRFDVPAQDLGLAMDRLPALPRDGFVIKVL